MTPTGRSLGEELSQTHSAEARWCQRLLSTCGPATMLKVWAPHWGKGHLPSDLGEWGQRKPPSLPGVDVDSLQREEGDMMP